MQQCAAAQALCRMKQERNERPATRRQLDEAKANKALDCAKQQDYKGFALLGTNLSPVRQ